MFDFIYIEPRDNPSYQFADVLNAINHNFSILSGGTGLSATTISGGTFYSGSTPLETIIKNIEHYKPYIEKNGQYFVTANDFTINCTANTFTVILPTAIGIKGKLFNIKNTGNGTIYLSGTSNQTIDGLLSQTASTQYSSYNVQSTGINWIII